MMLVDGSEEKAVDGAVVSGDDGITYCCCCCIPAISDGADAVSVLLVEQISTSSR